MHEYYAEAGVESSAPVPTRTILVGTSASAEVVSPIVCANTPSASNARFLIRLDEPLVDDTGAIALPEESLLVVSARPLSEDVPLVELDVVAIVIEGREYTPPNGMIAVRGEDGDPLMAEEYSSHDGDMFGRDMMLILSRVVEGVGELTNRPTTTSSTSVVSGLGSATTSTSHKSATQLYGSRNGKWLR